MRALKSEILDLRVVVHALTNMAARVSEDGDASKAVWLPLSQIEIEVKRRSGALLLCEAKIPGRLETQMELA